MDKLRAEVNTWEKRTNFHCSLLIQGFEKNTLPDLKTVQAKLRDSRNYVAELDTLIKNMG